MQTWRYTSNTQMERKRHKNKSAPAKHDRKEKATEYKQKSIPPSLSMKSYKANASFLENPLIQ